MIKVGCFNMLNTTVIRKDATQFYICMFILRRTDRVFLNSADKREWLFDAGGYKY